MECECAERREKSARAGDGRQEAGEVFRRCGRCGISTIPTPYHSISYQSQEKLRRRQGHRAPPPEARQAALGLALAGSAFQLGGGETSETPSTRRGRSLPAATVRARHLAGRKRQSGHPNAGTGSILSLVLSVCDADKSLSNPALTQF